MSNLSDEKKLPGMPFPISLNIKTDPIEIREMNSFSLHFSHIKKIHHYKNMTATHYSNNVLKLHSSVPSTQTESSIMHYIRPCRGKTNILNIDVDDVILFCGNEKRMCYLTSDNNLYYVKANNIRKHTLIIENIKANDIDIFNKHIYVAKDNIVIEINLYSRKITYLEHGGQVLYRTNDFFTIRDGNYLYIYNKTLLRAKIRNEGKYFGACYQLLIFLGNNIYCMYNLNGVLLKQNALSSLSDENHDYSKIKRCIFYSVYIYIEYPECVDIYWVNEREIIKLYCINNFEDIIYDKIKYLQDRITNDKIKQKKSQKCSCVIPSNIEEYIERCDYCNLHKNMKDKKCSDFSFVKPYYAENVFRDAGYFRDIFDSAMKIFSQRYINPEKYDIPNKIIDEKNIKLVLDNYGQMHLAYKDRINKPQIQNLHVLDPYEWSYDYYEINFEKIYLINHYIIGKLGNAAYIYNNSGDILTIYYFNNKKLRIVVRNEVFMFFYDIDGKEDALCILEDHIEFKVKHLTADRIFNVGFSDFFYEMAGEFYCNLEIEPLKCKNLNRAINLEKNNQSSPKNINTLLTIENRHNSLANWLLYCKLEDDIIGQDMSWEDIKIEADDNLDKIDQNITTIQDKIYYHKNHIQIHKIDNIRNSDKLMTLENLQRRKMYPIISEKNPRQRYFRNEKYKPPIKIYEDTDGLIEIRSQNSTNYSENHQGSNSNCRQETTPFVSRIENKERIEIGYLYRKKTKKVQIIKPTVQKINKSFADSSTYSYSYSNEMKPKKVINKKYTVDESNSEEEWAEDINSCNIWNWCNIYDKEDSREFYFTRLKKNIETFKKVDAFTKLDQEIMAKYENKKVNIKPIYKRAKNYKYLQNRNKINMWASFLYSIESVQFTDLENDDIGLEGNIYEKIDRKDRQRLVLNPKYRKIGAVQYTGNVQKTTKNFKEYIDSLLDNKRSLYRLYTYYKKLPEKKIYKKQKQCVKKIIQIQYMQCAVLSDKFYYQLIALENVLDFFYINRILYVILKNKILLYNNGIKMNVVYVTAEKCVSHWDGLYLLSQNWIKKITTHLADIGIECDDLYSSGNYLVYIKKNRLYFIKDLEKKEYKEYVITNKKLN